MTCNLLVMNEDGEQIVAGTLSVVRDQVSIDSIALGYELLVSNIVESPVYSSGELIPPEQAEEWMKALPQMYNGSSLRAQLLAKKSDTDSPQSGAIDCKERVMNLVCKQDGDLHLIYGEVYAPNRPDAQGEYMTRDEIRKAAHEFLRSGKMGSIDVMHDNKVVKGCSVVESFVAPDDSQVFIPGSWVVGMHVPDQDLWEQVKKQEINGFSMEALVTRYEQEVEVEVPPVVTGVTSKWEEHQHRFFVSYDEQGNFKGGRTDDVGGHSHQIVAGTHTQDAEGHRHRFSCVDNLTIG